MDALTVNNGNHLTVSGSEMEKMTDAAKQDDKFFARYGKIDINCKSEGNTNSRQAVVALPLIFGHNSLADGLQ